MPQAVKFPRWISRRADPMRAILLLVFCFTLAAHAAALERITQFKSDIVVNPDASLSVTETITVVAEGLEIKHGIFRDFPTTYESRDGLWVTVGFSVSSITRDGQPEPYKIERLADGKRVRIGSADRFVGEGSHTYVIAYETNRQIGFFPDYDELYWNVTGNRWKFPIQNASVAVRLPDGAVIRQHAEYTGSQGSTARQAEGRKLAANIYRAETTAELAGYEGFTIAVAWQKGIIAPPGGAQRIWWMLTDYSWAAMGFLTLLGTAAYFLFAWSRVGRDPPGGPIIPLFKPPAALGPAGTRYVWMQDFDNKSFAAALVGLAVKGRLKISDEDGDYAVTKLADQGHESLSSSEAALYDAIPAGVTRLEQSSHARVGKMRRALAQKLKSEFQGALFLRNLGWFWIGAIFSVAGLVSSAFLIPGDEGLVALFISGFLAVWWGVVLTAAWGALNGLAAGRGILAKARALLTLFMLVPFVGAGVGVPMVVFFTAEISRALMGFGILVVAVGLLNLLFYHLMSAPTPQGRKVLDQIEGFRMYMRTAEEERLKILNPPEKTPELFERYLPYALALDCENEWNEKFAAVLAAAAAAGATSPAWYSGSSWSSGNMGSFTDSLGSSLASSAGAASNAPGSSSGSGGGGSSGGGGGGGGGGGW
jgi:Predicted membrane protein (DUF2207)